MRQRAMLGELVPEPERHATEDAQTSGDPFVLLFLLGSSASSTSSISWISSVRSLITLSGLNRYDRSGLSKLT